MLNVATAEATGNKTPVEPLFSKTNVAERRRHKAWLEDRISRARREGSVNTEIVTLTPALAEMLLERNPGNRNIRSRTVDNYCSDIKAGNWAVNGESIKVSIHGELNDGQHRCHAVIAAGRSIETLITFGLARESRMTVDQGAVRTAGNYLSMAGIKDANVTAAVASFVWQYENHGRIATGSNARPTKVQIAETYRSHPGITESVSAIPARARAGRSKSVLAFCHYILSRRSRTNADYFIMRLCLGDGLSRQDPIYHCREKLLTDNRLTSGEKVELIFRTWNAVRREKSAKKCPPILGELPKLER